MDLGNVNPSKVVDVERCPLATDGINESLPEARHAARQRVDEAFASGDGKRVGKRGATLLFRETTEDGTVTDNNAHVSERVNGMVFNFKVSVVGLRTVVRACAGGGLDVGGWVKSVRWCRPNSSIAVLCSSRYCVGMPCDAHVRVIRIHT